MTNLIIFGGSRGLGAAFATGLPKTGDVVWLVSRKKPSFLDHYTGRVKYQWIEADLTDPTSPLKIAAKVDSHPLDLIVYNAGIWESSAFSDEYSFPEITQKENHRVLTVNLTAVIDCLQALIPNVRSAQNGKIVVIGSTSGLDNSSGPEVAYAASKFGVRGVVHALREILRPDGIPVTCINPGTIATEITLEEEAEKLPEYDGKWGLPVSDLVKLVKTIMTLSRFACVKEIDIPAINDPHA